MTTENLLEKQLEMLFSDAALPELPGTPERFSEPATAAALPPAFPRPVNAPRGLAGPNRAVGTSVTLAILVVVGFLLVEQVSRAFGASGSALPTARTEVLAHASTATVSPPVIPATTGRPGAASILPAAQAPTSAVLSPTSQATAPPTIAPTPSVFPGRETVSPRAPQPSPTVTPASTVEPTTPVSSPTATVLKEDPTRSAAPTPTITASSPVAGLPPTPAPAALESAGSFPSRLIIPSIGLQAPIIAVGKENLVIGGKSVTTWTVPRYFAAGWHRNSALPGRSGNTVLNGHQDTHGGVFRNIDALETDDEIIIYAGAVAHSYRVSEQHLLEEEGQPLSVRVENARWIMPTADERLTLVTCAPDGTSTHRLIVVALPVQSPITPDTP